MKKSGRSKPNRRSDKCGRLAQPTMTEYETSINAALNREPNEQSNLPDPKHERRRDKGKDGTEEFGLETSVA